MEIGTLFSHVCGFFSSPITITDKGIKSLLSSRPRKGER
jgi:hypothetical protein